MHIKNYELIFDKPVLRQLQEAVKNKHIQEILRTMLDQLEENGSNSGTLLDTILHIYEIKNKHPQLRLYYKPLVGTNEILVLNLK